MNRLAILGASGHGKVVADIAECMGYSDIVFFDDDASKETCLGFPVVGDVKDFVNANTQDYFVAVGNARARQQITELLASHGIESVSLIHPSATVAKSTRIKPGTAVMAGAVVNPDVRIGCSCIINTGATIDHDSIIGDYCHISVGSHLAGTVVVGNRSWVGAGAVVSNNLTICQDCIIGAGAVVVKNISAPGSYVGVPAAAIHHHQKRSED